MAQKFDEMGFHIANDLDKKRGVFVDGDPSKDFISIPDLTLLTKRESKAKGYNQLTVTGTLPKKSQYSVQQATEAIVKTFGGNTHVILTKKG